MALILSDEQQAIRDAARDYLRDHADFERLRATIESDAGWDEDLWRGFAVELGFAGLGVDEAHGGIGLGPIEQALILEELGRTLAPIPWFESVVLAGGIVQRAFAGDARTALLGRIAAGDVATLAMRDNSGATDAIGPRLEGGRLFGEAHYVPFGHVASLLIVAAQAGNTVAIATVPTDRVIIDRVTTLDLTRPYATVRLDGIEPEFVAEDAGYVLKAGLSAAGGLLASEQVGGAARSLEETVAYSRERVQFGRAIGSFQAMKHRMADMKLLVDSARSAADWAARAIASGSGFEQAAAGARVYCSQAYLTCAADAIQLHGGIGYTWEHHAHLFFKRARSSATLLGSVDSHRDAIARILIDEVAA